MSESGSGMQVAFEMFEFAMMIREQSYRREHPAATNEEVEAFIQAWLLDRPGAPDGDCVGRRVEWPRRA